MNYLTHGAMFRCTHGGTVRFTAPKANAWVLGAHAVLTVADLENAPIVGCPQTGPGLKPCTAVKKVLIGQARGIDVNNQIPLLQHTLAITDGSPPGMCMATGDGGSTAQILLPAVAAPTTASIAHAAEDEADSAEDAASDGEDAAGDTIKLTLGLDLEDVTLPPHAWRSSYFAHGYVPVIVTAVQDKGKMRRTAIVPVPLPDAEGNDDAGRAVTIDLPRPLPKENMWVLVGTSHLEDQVLMFEPTDDPGVVVAAPGDMKPLGIDTSLADGRWQSSSKAVLKALQDNGADKALDWPALAAVNGLTAKGKSLDTPRRSRAPQILKPDETELTVRLRPRYPRLAAMHVATRLLNDALDEAGAGLSEPTWTRRLALAAIAHDAAAITAEHDAPLAHRLATVGAARTPVCDLLLTLDEADSRRAARQVLAALDAFAAATSPPDADGPKLDADAILREYHNFCLAQPWHAGLCQMDALKEGTQLDDDARRMIRSVAHATASNHAAGVIREALNGVVNACHDLRGLDERAAWSADVVNAAGWRPVCDDDVYKRWSGWIGEYIEKLILPAEPPDDRLHPGVAYLAQLMAWLGADVADNPAASHELQHAVARDVALVMRALPLTDPQPAEWIGRVTEAVDVERLVGGPKLRRMPSLAHRIKSVDDLDALTAAAAGPPSAGASADDPGAGERDPVRIFQAAAFPLVAWALAYRHHDKSDKGGDRDSASTRDLPAIVERMTARARQSLDTGVAAFIVGLSRRLWSGDSAAPSLDAEAADRFQRALPYIAAADFARAAARPTMRTPRRDMAFAASQWVVLANHADALPDDSHARGWTTRLLGGAPGVGAHLRRAVIDRFVNALPHASSDARAALADLLDAGEFGVTGYRDLIEREVNLAKLPAPSGHDDAALDALLDSAQQGDAALWWGGSLAAAMNSRAHSLTERIDQLAADAAWRVDTIYVQDDDSASSAAAAPPMVGIVVEFAPYVLPGDRFRARLEVDDRTIAAAMPRIAESLPKAVGIDLTAMPCESDGDGGMRMSMRIRPVEESTDPPQPIDIDTTTDEQQHVIARIRWDRLSGREVSATFNMRDEPPRTLRIQLVFVDTSADAMTGFDALTATAAEGGVRLRVLPFGGGP